MLHPNNKRVIIIYEAMIRLFGISIPHFHIRIWKWGIDMPNKRIIASYIMITLLLFGCNMNSETGLSEQGHHTQFTKISTDQSIDQHISNQVKRKITR